VAGCGRGSLGWWQFMVECGETRLAVATGLAWGGRGKLGCPLPLFLL